MGRDEARRRLVDALDARHRPEMREMEKVLVLQILDSSWMEHLRAMDHLRSSVGLQGYAQIDPKVEYKREGMKIFDEMWNGVSDKVTDLVFRVEQFDPEFLSYLGARWQLDRAQTIHEAPAPEPSAAAARGGGPRAAGGGHRRQPAIGRRRSRSRSATLEERSAGTTPAPADRVKSSKPAACGRKPPSILSEARPPEALERGRSLVRDTAGTMAARTIPLTSRAPGRVSRKSILPSGEDRVPGAAPSRSSASRPTPQDVDSRTRRAGHAACIGCEASVDRLEVT